MENETPTDLAEQLREKLLSLQKSSNLSRDVSSIILESEAYAKLQNFIANYKYIHESNKIWNELETAIIKSSPKFKTHLQLLTGGNLKAQDLHLALLIKCGVTPTQMTVLVGKAKGTISYRREALCVRIFGRNDNYYYECLTKTEYEEQCKEYKTEYNNAIVENAGFNEWNKYYGNVMYTDFS